MLPGVLGIFGILLAMRASNCAGLSLSTYYNETKFIRFYQEISLGSKTYNNVFLVNKLFQQIDNFNDTQCTRELTIFRDQSMNASELWPLIMLDASGSFQASMFQGNLNHLGDWSQCYSVKNQFLVARPCRAIVHLSGGRPQNASFIPHNVPFIFNLCLPSTCTENHLIDLLNDWSESNELHLEFKCYSESKSSSISFKIIIATTAIILVGSSLYDFYHSHHNNETKLNKWNAFSIQRNLKTLVSIRENNELGCLDGLKFFTQMMVIWYHIVLQSMAVFQAVSNKFYFDQVLRTWEGSWYICITLAVDSYLVMSGLLVSYTAVANDKVKNLLKYYFHRYIRISPSYLAVVILFITAGSSYCEGPQCASLNKELDNCNQFWWTNILYINNYFPSFKQSCLYHSWYLALDFQLYLLSPILIYMVQRCRPRVAYLVLAGLLSVAIVIPAVSTYLYSLPAEEYYLDTAREIKDYYRQFYTPLQTRFGPWLIGFILGLILKLDKKLVDICKENMWFKATGWVISGIIMATVLTVSSPSKPINIATNALQNALKKNAWALCVSWIILASSKGFAGILNNVLSWKYLQILGKLSYGAFLIHRIIIALFLFNLRTPLYYSFSYQIITLTAVAVVSYFYSLLLYVSVEGPFGNLDKLYLK